MYRFKEARERKDMTQGYVADYLGMQRASYANIENGKRDPDTETLIKLSQCLEASLDYLLGQSEIMEASSQRGEILTEEEKRLILIYRELNFDGRNVLIDSAEALLKRASFRQEEYTASME